ncbi:MAG: SDR family oxidoreductase, partial [Candidatus Kapaibacterium sp.]
HDGGHAVGVTADCTDFEAIEEMRAEVEWELGQVDLLVPFAGQGGTPIATAEITEESWRSVIDGNLTATFLTVKCFLPGMIDRRRGAIITMASSAARLPSPASAAYAAAKAGIVMFSRHLANEVGKHAIRVHCISPSAISNEWIRSHMSDEDRERLAASFPLGRIGEPEDVALATLFLASESSAWLTGLTLDVAGGRIIM